MTIKRLTKIGGAAIIAILLFAGAFAAFNIDSIRLGSELDRKNQLSQEFTADILPPPMFLVEAFLETNLLSADPENYDKHADKLASLEQEWRTRRAYWSESDMPSGLKAQIEELAANEGEAFWSEVFDTFKPAVKDGDEAVADASMARLVKIFYSHREKIEAQVLASAALLEENASLTEETLFWTNLQLSVSGILLIGSILVGLFYIQRHVVNTLAETAGTMTAMAAGDLDAGRTEEHRGNEIGDMTRAIEVFREASYAQVQNADKQKHVVDCLSSGLDRLADGDLAYRIEERLEPEYEALRLSFNSSVERLAELMKQVSESASSVNTGASEIRAASDDLASRNELQAANLEETAAAMSQVTELVKQSAQNAANAQGSISSTHSEAHEGGAVVKRAVEAMASIEKSASEITQIIDVIDGIAFQTNLLALNAGVEAARAGDAGKGFAVVANEVRALAQRSADAARDIKELITTSTEQVGTGVNLVGETGDLLENIVERIGKVSEQVSDIASAAKTQAGNLEQVNASVGEMDRMTQQNAAMVEQSTAAARSLAEEAGELGNLVGQFRVQAGASGDRSVARLNTAPPLASPSSQVPIDSPAGGGGAVAGNLALAVGHEEEDWSEF